MKEFDYFYIKYMYYILIKIEWINERLCYNLQIDELQM